MEKENVKEVPSLSTQDEADVSVKHYSAQEVANAFMKQYYYILQKSPEEAHKFYKDESVLMCPSTDGSTKSSTTLKGIDHGIMALNIKDWNPDLTTMHAQESIMTSVIAVVNGSLTDNDNVTRHFSRTFLLAPQDGGGFYVHNDFLRFMEINKVSETSSPLKDDAANPLNLTAPQADDTTKDSSLETAPAPKKEEDDSGNKAADSSEGKSLLPAEPNKKGKTVASHPAPNKEDAKKVSYASIVAKARLVTPTTQTSDKQSSASLTVTKPSAPLIKTSMSPITGASENIYDVKSIRVRDLPPQTTQESLLEVVKTFGPVKLKNIQIKEYSEDGYRYAFVEFDYPNSARSAVEARFVHLEGRECEIHYKRSSNQGGYNYMGRSQSGRGGFQNDNFWSRGGEGRSSGSWDRHNQARSST